MQLLELAEGSVVAVEAVEEEAEQAALGFRIS
jgi:hypothetical protein